ncbi:MAG: hypothetical protein ABSB25_01310 [Sedimentisphaerales bacterium]|jgi:hypothetical protein
MNEGRFGVRVFIISLAALVFSNCSVIITLLLISRTNPSPGVSAFIRYALSISYLFGWLAGLLLAIVSLVMVRRSRDLLIKIFVWIISSLAIISAMFWGLVAYTMVNFRW